MTIPVNSYLSSSPKQLREEDPCPICLKVFKETSNIKALACTHLYHRGCIDAWLMTVSSCPLCRRKVTVDWSLGGMVLAVRQMAAQITLLLKNVQQFLEIQLEDRVSV